MAIDVNFGSLSPPVQEGDRRLFRIGSLLYLTDLEEKSGQTGAAGAVLNVEQMLCWQLFLHIYHHISGRIITTSLLPHSEPWLREIIPKWLEFR